MPPLPSTIQFKNGHQAQAVTQEPGDSAAALVGALRLDTPRSVILVAGGAEALPAGTRAFLTQLFGRAVARAAGETGAVIIDGGTQAGVMEVLGQAAADRGHRGPVLGIAPAGLVACPDGSTAGGPSGDVVPLEPNHSHFILADATAWGGELKTMFDVAAVFAKGAKAVTVVAGGGPHTLAEVRESVRRGWPVIAIEGSGGVADALAARPPGEVEDPMLAEIYADGELEVFPLHGAAEALARRIVRALTGDTTLRLAWERFAALDAAAGRHQRTFVKVQATILGLAVLVTVLALLKTTLESRGALRAGTVAMQTLLYVILVMPIVISILIAAANRFRSGNKWLLLRAAAETVKREIFRYRVRAGAYRDAGAREAVLAQNVENITRRLVRSEVNTSALAPYEGPIPPRGSTSETDGDALARLTPPRYVAERLMDQLAFYRRRAAKLERQLTALQWSILLLGGVATFLAAIGLDLWLALITTLVTAISGFLGHRQVEGRLMMYNQTATDLENVRGWWIALPAEEQGDARNVDKLVDCVESLLGSELGGWLRKMQDALDDLRKDEERTRRGSGRP
jgi:predicted Rossmann-fold nucleotide-binding protein